MLCFLKSTCFAVKVSMVTEMLKYYTKHSICAWGEIDDNNYNVGGRTHFQCCRDTCTCGFLECQYICKSRAAEFRTAWNHSIIISQQMFSFIYFHTLNLLLFSSWIKLHNTVATCSGHEREPLKTKTGNGKNPLIA